MVLWATTTTPPGRDTTARQPLWAHLLDVERGGRVQGQLSAAAPRAPDRRGSRLQDPRDGLHVMSDALARRHRPRTPASSRWCCYLELRAIIRVATNSTARRMSPEAHRARGCAWTAEADREQRQAARGAPDLDSATRCHCPSTRRPSVSRARTAPEPLSNSSVLTACQLAASSCTAAMVNSNGIVKHGWIRRPRRRWLRMDLSWVTDAALA